MPIRIQLSRRKGWKKPAGAAPTKATRTKSSKPPVGASWRILAHGRNGPYEMHSKDYPAFSTMSDGTKIGRPIPESERVPERTVFDELVIMGVIHVEQMDTRTWWVGIGNGEKFMIMVGRDGTVKRGEIYE